MLEEIHTPQHRAGAAESERELSHDLKGNVASLLVASVPGVLRNFKWTK